jgi:hypothetical protein
VFHTAGSLEPVVAVVFGNDERDVELLGESDILDVAQPVFLERMNVRVVEKIVKSIPDACMASMTNLYN